MLLLSSISQELQPTALFTQGRVAFDRLKKHRIADELTLYKSAFEALQLIPATHDTVIP